MIGYQEWGWLDRMMQDIAKVVAREAIKLVWQMLERARKARSGWGPRASRRGALLDRGCPHRWAGAHAFGAWAAPARIGTAGYRHGNGGRRRRGGALFIASMGGNDAA